MAIPSGELRETGFGTDNGAQRLSPPASRSSTEGPPPRSVYQRKPGLSASQCGKLWFIGWELESAPANLRATDLTPACVPIE